MVEHVEYIDSRGVGGIGISTVDRYVEPAQMVRDLRLEQPGLDLVQLLRAARLVLLHHGPGRNRSSQPGGSSG